MACLLSRNIDEKLQLRSRTEAVMTAISPALITVVRTRWLRWLTIKVLAGPTMLRCRLLINFHEMKVTDGISRLILPGANL